MSRKQGKRARAQRTLWDTAGWGNWTNPDTFWPYIPPKPPSIDFDWVTEQVATGGGIWTEDDVARLRAEGITHIVTAADELTATSERLLSASGIAYLLNGLPDDGKWKPTWWFAKTVDFALGALQDPNAKIYCHCWSGKNRGPSHAYAVLLATGYDRATAERLIREARPKVILLYREDADEAIGRMTA